MKKVGVEKGLSNVADYLSKEGYSVQVLNESMNSDASQNLDSFDVIVSADYDTDMLGFSDTTTKTPVVNASGLTPEQIKNAIDEKSTK